MEIKPQSGFQEKALACTADIAVIGGAAGGGKTWVNLVEFLTYHKVPGFGATVFRRSMPEITAQGGLWDASLRLYPACGGTPNITERKWTFGNSSIKFASLQYDEDVYSWLGTEVPLIIFEELTRFSKFQFTFMMSRNRSTCGVKPYIRASCNPDPDSWVKEFIEWWINPVTGFPIPEREGVHRYMIMDKDNYVWGDTKEEVRDKCPHIFNAPDLIATGINYKDLIKSVTFIPGTLAENKILLEINPQYYGNLLALPEAEQQQFLKGNWKIRTDGKGLFNNTAVDNIFTNPRQQFTPRIIEYDYRGVPVYEPLPRVKSYITCDAARFGRDLCVIHVWRGWEIIHTSIFKQSDVHDIGGEIERLRQQFGVVRSNVMVDADGVGSDTVSMGGYQSFHGGSSARPDPEQRGSNENYKNFKTQCYYRFAKRVNEGQVVYTVNTQTCKIYETPGKGIFGLTISLGTKVCDVRDLIKQDFRAIKRAKTEMDQGVIKMQINEKEEQKSILGRSPDFGDAGSMREAFELIRVYDSGIEID